METIETKAKTLTAVQAALVARMENALGSNGGVGGSASMFVGLELGGGVSLRADCEIAAQAAGLELRWLGLNGVRLSRAKAPARSVAGKAVASVAKSKSAPLTVAPPIAQPAQRRDPAVVMLPAAQLAEIARLATGRAGAPPVAEQFAPVDAVAIARQARCLMERDRAAGRNTRASDAVRRVMEPSPPDDPREHARRLQDYASAHRCTIAEAAERLARRGSN